MQVMVFYLRPPTFNCTHNIRLHVLLNRRCTSPAASNLKEFRLSSKSTLLKFGNLHSLCCTMRYLKHKYEYLLKSVQLYYKFWCSFLKTLSAAFCKLGNLMSGTKKIHFYSFHYKPPSPLLFLICLYIGMLSHS